MSKRTRTRLGHANPTTERNRRKKNNAKGRWSSSLMTFHWGAAEDPIVPLWYTAQPGARLLKRLLELRRRRNSELIVTTLKIFPELSAS